MSIDVIDWARDNMMPMHGVGCPVEGPCVCGISDRYERWLDDAHALRAALAAEADRATPKGMTPNEMRRQWPANVAYVEREAVAAWLASPDTVDVVARVPLFQRIVDDTSTLESYEEVAAALIEAIRQEMEKA